MIGGLFFVPMLCLLGILISWYRRDPRRLLDGPAEDAPLRLVRWATGLLAPQRAEWGQAMLGELDHIDGRGPRWRFSAGCAGAALLLPPWGRAAGAVWAGLAGLFKAVAGTNEVISTIMLNWTAIWVAEYLFGQGGPMQGPQPSIPISNPVRFSSARSGRVGRWKS